MGPIDPATAEAVRLEISRVLIALVRNVQTEIQDDGEFLLVRIESDTRAADDEAAEIIKAASSVLERLIRPRINDYAWMVNVEWRQSLLDSEVGGRLLPDSGAWGARL